MSNEKMRGQFEAWHESRRLKIIAESDRITAEKIADGWSDSVVTSAESTYEAIERITWNNSSFVPFQAGYQAALAQQASEPAKCVDDGGNCGAGGYCGKCEPEFSTELWAELFKLRDEVNPPNGEVSWKYAAIRERAKRASLEREVNALKSVQQCEPEVSQEPVAYGDRLGTDLQNVYAAPSTGVPKWMSVMTPLFTSPPDYEALKERVSEWQRMYETNRETIDKLQSRVAELEYLEHSVIVMTGISERVAAERDKLQTRVAELEGIAIRTDEVITEATENVIQIIAERDKLQSECDQLRNRPFECWSNDDGDSWCEHPADSEFVGGLKVGDTFELLAGYDSVRVKYVVTKAPDDIDDDYEVKRAK